MNARPLLFSAPMIRALLAGAKTQTRRAIKHVTPGAESIYRPFRHEPNNWQGIGADDLMCWYGSCPFGIEGSFIWVRETWQHAPQTFCSCPQPSEPSPCDDWSNGTGCRSSRGGVVYAADGASAARWCPSIFMPRWASRLTLRITEVRVQRLQAISEADAISEGATPHLLPLPPVPRASPMAKLPTIYEGPRDIYGSLWESINGAGSWAANPFVWCLSFEVIKANVDDVMRSKAA